MNGNHDDFARVGAVFTAAAGSAGRPMSEAGLQAVIVTECERLGLWVFAVSRSDRAQVSRVSGTGRGWPDLTISGDGGVLFREVKSSDGETSGRQDGWLWRLRHAGHDAGVWRPGDWASGRIRAELEAIA